jgi:hypothetical protein
MTRRSDEALEVSLALSSTSRSRLLRIASAAPRRPLPSRCSLAAYHGCQANMSSFTTGSLPAMATYTCNSELSTGCAALVATAGSSGDECADLGLADPERLPASSRVDGRPHGRLATGWSRSSLAA